MRRARKQFSSFAASASQAFFLATLIIALFGCRARSTSFSSHWLHIEGRSSPQWCPDFKSWTVEREVAVRRLAAVASRPRLPLEIVLDENLVAAAELRRTIHPVSRCGAALCGVASAAFSEEWDRWIAAALFAPADAPAMESEALGASITGVFRGEDIDSVAAALMRANVLPTPVAMRQLDDELFEIPLYASLFRFVDPHHRLTFDQLLQATSAPSPATFRRWTAHLGALAPQIPDHSLQLPLFGATFSVINDIGQSPISDRSHLEIEHLGHAGYNAVALIPFAGQDGPTANEVRMWNRNPGSETDLDLQVAASTAHRLGMRVLLKPQVWVGHGTDSLHIDPHGGWDRWFASYRRYILHHALLARLEHIEWLAIGTELTIAERQPHWRALIRDIRSLYPGHLVYAANWDAFAAAPFWDELDAVGIDVYAPLSDKDSPTDAELLQGARRNVDEITRVAMRTGKPVLITEVGFPSTKSPWLEPWSERRSESIHLTDQARCFRAFFKAVGEAPWFSGFFIWKYESDPGYRDPSGFFPDFKPAQNVIESFLADVRQRPARTPPGH